MNEETVNPFKSNIQQVIASQGLARIPTEPIKQKTKPVDEQSDVGFIQGAKRSWFATQLKELYNYQNPFNYQQYKPTEQQRKRAIEELGYSLDRYNSALRGASTRADFENNLRIAKDNYQYTKRMSESTLASRMLSALGSAVSDPFTLTPIGGKNIVTRVAIGAVSGAMTSVMNEYVKGEQDDPIQSFGWGMALGGTIEGMAKVSPFTKKAFGDMGRRARARMQAVAKGQYINIKDAYSATGVPGATLYAINKLQGYLPAITVKGARDKAQSAQLRGLYDKMFGGAQRGVRTVDPNTGQVIHKQFTSSDFSAEQWKSLYHDQGSLRIDEYAANFATLLKQQNLQPDELEHYIRRAIDGHATPLDGNKLFKQLKSSKEGFYGKRGDQLIGAGIIVGQTSSTKLYKYQPHKLSRVKLVKVLQNLIDNKGLNTAQAKAFLRKKIKNLLVRSLEDPAYYTALKKKYQQQIAKKNPNQPVTFQESAFRKWVDEQAQKDALGYVDQKQMVKNNLSPQFTGITYSYQTQRNPWKFTVQDVDGFSIDRLMVSSQELMRSYNNRSSADLGANKAFGVTNAQQLRQKFNEALNKQGQKLLDPTYKHKQEQTTAVKAMLDTYYGRLGQDADDNGSWLAALGDSLSNITFFAHNAYMGLLNHFQITEGIKAYGPLFFFKSIPGLQKRLSDWTKGGMSSQQRNDIMNHTFGKQVKRRGLWRQMRQRNIQRFQGDRIKEAMVSGTQWIATHSPLTRYLDASNTSIVDQARSQFLGDLVRYAHGARNGIPFLDKKIRARLSISDAQYNKLIRNIKKGTAVRNDRIQLTADWANSVQRDLQTLMTLRRLGNYVADEVIQRNHLADTFLWRGSKANSFMRLAMQFKTFALRSYNKRLVKSINRMQEGDRRGQALTWLIGGALSTLGFIGQASLMTLGMSDQQKRRYYKNTLGTQNPDFTDSQVLFNVAINGFMRSSILAYPSLILNSLGFKTGIKTSVDEGAYTRDQAQQLNLDEFARANIPAYNTVRGIFGLRADARNIIESNYFEPQQFRNRDRQKYQKSFARNLKAVTPNVPYIQNEIINIIAQEDK